MTFDLPATAARGDYGMRGGSRDELERALDIYFARIARTEADEGDLLLVDAGPAQLHLLILTAAGYLHADAGLRRVVEVPGDVPWPVLSAWRRAA